MKAVNLMNFVRRIDERMSNSTARLLAFTKEQMKLIKEYDVDHTFLLQYDAVSDPDFSSFFREEATKRTELGLWYEIVEPLTTACGLPYRSEKGWKWDWHIIPGFSMAYTPAERELLIDEAMRKFRETFGFYPRTVASWLIDTHTINYLSEHYEIDTVAICRDQVNTDAYTLVGGYFNQAYYPSKRNIFTPAQTEEFQTNVPVFRLLGPCPIHNYDNHKYSSEELLAPTKKPCYTLEPSSRVMGGSPHAVKWMFDSYYSEESLGFAYAQIGQENCFLNVGELVLDGTRLQIDTLLARGDVSFMKMCDTGRAFREKFPKETPPTSVVAPNNWDSTDVQSFYYDCKNYTANLFRFEEAIFLRSFFLFDERVKEHYLEKTCKTFDAIYENLPIVDSKVSEDSEKKSCGLMIDTDGSVARAERVGENALCVSWCGGSVTFREDRIVIRAPRLVWYGNSRTAAVELDRERITLEYKGVRYGLLAEDAKISSKGEDLILTSQTGTITLIPQKI